MQKTSARAAIALLAMGIGTAAFAAPSFRSSLKKAAKAIQQEADQSPKPYEWSEISVIQSGLVRKGAALTLNDTFASYRGRTFDLRQVQLKVGITNWIEVFGGRETILAKGHAVTSRFYDNNNFLGFRVVVIKPTETNHSALSLQYESLQPGAAEINTSNGDETFSGPKENLLFANYGDRKDNQYQIAYASIEAPAFYDAHSTSIGYGRDYQLNDWFLARLEAHLIAQSFNGPADHSNYEMKSLFYGGLALNACPWLTLEGDLTVLPSGMPFAGGEFTGVSGFAIYEPGGIVDDLRHDFLAFGSLRLMAHWKF